MKQVVTSLALVFLVACSASPAIRVAFNPDPPRLGTQTLTVTLKEGDTPVKGAEVSVATVMPAMAMSGPAVTASDNGDGTYTAHLSLQYATRWVFDITASASGKTTHAQITRDVR
ncbi:MAG: FixH family protein [Candidatus Tyrphobacter sp.]